MAESLATNAAQLALNIFSCQYPATTLTDVSSTGLCGKLLWVVINVCDSKITFLVSGLQINLLLSNLLLCNLLLSLQYLTLIE